MYIILSALVLSLGLLSASWAADTKDEKSLGKEATEISKTADNEKGEKVVVQKLETEFKVTDAQIQSLRDKKLGFGEITIVFSLAQKLPGGITDANIGEIVTLREGPPTMGWGEVAKKLDLKLGPVISQVKSLDKAAAREMMREEKGEKERMEKEAGRHEGMHGEIGGHEGMAGEGASHGKGR
jgi:hypothetical protein